MTVGPLRSHLNNGHSLTNCFVNCEVLYKYKGSESCQPGSHFSEVPRQELLDFKTNESLLFNEVGILDCKNVHFCFVLYPVQLSHFPFELHKQTCLLSI